MAKAASSIADSDIIDRSIRGGNNWSLLPQKGFLSSVYPCEKVCQKVGFIRFIPEWLAKNSSQKKVYRLLRELRQILGERVTGSRFSIKFDYAEPLCKLIVYNLLGGKENLETVLEILQEYNLTLDNVKEQLVAAIFPNEDPFRSVPTATKTALTKLYKSRLKDEAVLKAKKKKNNEEAVKYDVFSGDFVEEKEEEEEEVSQDEQSDADDARTTQPSQESDQEETAASARGKGPRGGGHANKRGAKK